MRRRERWLRGYGPGPQRLPRGRKMRKLTMILALGIAFGGLYGLGTFLIDVPRTCDDSSRLRLEIASGLPLVRNDAMIKLSRCARK